MIGHKEKKLKEVQSEYDHLFRTDPIRDEDRAYRWMARLLKREGGLREKGDGILDLACGGGFFLREAAQIVNSKPPLMGVDISHEALKLAQKECPTAHLLLAAAENLPFCSASFGVLSCLGSLEHFLDLKQALSEMRRVVKRGGVLLILVPNLFWYKDILSVVLTAGRINRNQTHERFASLGEWEELLKGAGLTILKTLKYNGIAKSRFKQGLKDLLIPLRFSYHFLFICTQE